MLVYSSQIGEIVVYRLDNDFWDCYYEQHILLAPGRMNSLIDEQLNYCHFGSRTQLTAILQWPHAHKAAQYYRLLILNADLRKEATSLMLAVVEV